MNAIMYLLKTGCQWLMLSNGFPPHQIVFYYFDKWKWESVFEGLMDTLHVVVRKPASREDTPSLGIIDSRSVKSSHHVAADCGIDGNKKAMGARNTLWLTRLAFRWAL